MELFHHSELSLGNMGVIYSGYNVLLLRGLLMSMEYVLRSRKQGCCFMVQKNRGRRGIFMPLPFTSRHVREISSSTLHGPHLI